MKKTISLISAAALAALTTASLPVSAADGDKVYGTMNIPYADFYAAEIDNACDVVFVVISMFKAIKES